MSEDYDVTFSPYDRLNGDNDDKDSDGVGSFGNTTPWGAARSTAGAGRFHRKSRIIKWLILHSTGEKQVLTLDKRLVIKTFSLEIPNRDMRLMDTHLMNYDTIGQLLVRDNALVFSMEHVRMIITADKVIVPLEEGDRGDQRERFVVFLEHLLMDRKRARVACPDSGQGLGGHAGLGADHSDYARDSSATWGTEGTGGEEEEDEDMPFELRVLEAALGEICNFLAGEVEILQSRAQPAVELITRRADHETLEMVRRIKALRQRMVTRVGLIREVLERLTEDDGDMLRMCLTRQAEQQQQKKASAVAAASWLDTGVQAANLSPVIDPQATKSYDSSEASSSAGESIDPALSLSSTSLGTPIPRSAHKHHRSHEALARSLRRHPSNPQEGLAHMPSTALGPQLPHMDGEDYRDLLDVENLLESYFMLIDSTYQTLISLGEYIDDTEDLINIQLDASRNSLIRFEIMLSAGTFSLAIFAAVAGALGENLVLPDAITQDLWGFVLVNGLVIGFCIGIVALIYKSLAKRKLI